MKTISKEGKLLRVDDNEADLKVKAGWKYVAKSVWKEATRSQIQSAPVKQETETETVATTKKVYKKGQKNKEHK